MLVPTVGGLPIEATALLPHSARPTASSALAGVSWGSWWSPGGSVLFFSDRTVCIREPRALGLRIEGEKYDASTDIGAEFVRIDYHFAEIASIELGDHLNNVVPWILVGVDAREVQPGESIVKHAQSTGRAVAREILRAGLAWRVQVAVISGREDFIELILVPPGDERRITDRLEAVLVGPAVGDLPAAFDALFFGPRSKESLPTDATMVAAWTADRSGVWEQPWDNYTAADARWSFAFARITEALGGGCRVPPLVGAGDPPR